MKRLPQSPCFKALMCTTLFVITLTVIILMRATVNDTWEPVPSNGTTEAPPSNDTTEVPPSTEASPSLAATEVPWYKTAKGWLDKFAEGNAEVGMGISGFTAVKVGRTRAATSKEVAAFVLVCMFLLMPFTYVVMKSLCENTDDEDEFEEAEEAYGCPCSCFQCVLGWPKRREYVEI